MDVLLIESHPGLGRWAEAELELAGHRVLRCTDDDARATEQAPAGPDAPCVGLRPGGTCPLDGDSIEAAVLVRVGPELRTGEHGAICAARHRIPVVVSGEATGAPLPPVAESTLHGDIAAAVERAATSGTDHASAVMRELLSLGVVARHELEGDEPDVVFHVARTARRLALTIWLREGDERESEMVRAAGQALRAHDPHVPVIDVIVRALP